MTDIRIKKIYDIASRRFIQQGYDLTQIDHIVKEAGISVGSFYDLFSGKKVLLKFILKCTIDPAFMDSDISFPLKEDLFLHLDEEVILFLNESNRVFSEPLTRQAENYFFERMLSDAFDRIYKYRIGCLIVEKNASGCGKVFEYYKNYRSKFYQIILEYIKIYMKQGTVREVAFPELIVLFIVESMSWWAMDMKFDTFETREDISDDIAKKVCLDALIQAYRKE